MNNISFKSLSPKVKFGIVLGVYLLWVLWLGNPWLLLFTPIIFDIYITKKVNWTFWKKRGVKKHSKTVEWIDAILFAVVAATLIRTFFFEAYTIPTSSMEKSMLVGDFLFVSKVAYGPKIPNTPLAVPFTHHSLPVTGGKAYSELIKWPYKRIAGLTDIKRNDVIVFNFPAGDTIIVGAENPDYYSQVRSNARYYRSEHTNLTQQEAESEVRKILYKQQEIIARPVDKRENYIKRGVAMPGDIIELKSGQVYINGKLGENPDNMQYNYFVHTNGTPINRKKLQDIGLALEDISHSGSSYILPLTREMIEKLKKLPNVVNIVKYEEKEANPDIFPFDIKNYPWNADNFGPLQIPKKGQTVDLNLKTLPLYERIIRDYEINNLKVQNGTIYINGEIANSYTFKMNYYWMMGDNRHMSADSRYWGFVPEDHIVGKASFVWLSLDKDKSFLSKIRWSRFFMNIH